jgi:effector-binding domain-containing protein
MTTIGQPKIDTRTEQVYMGIRTIAPFSGMFKIVTKLSKDMYKWVKVRGVTPSGPPFLRFHVIDMRGLMDFTYGMPVAEALPNDGPVTTGTLSAGRYASLIFSGSGLAGNKALIEWVRANGYQFDRWDTEQGDNFRCRYESHLTDPRVQPRKTLWDIEVAIKLAD